MDRDQKIAAVVVLICLAVLPVCCYKLVTYPASQEHKEYVEDAINSCRNFCVAHQAEGFQWNGRNGCSCSFQLP